MSTYDKGQWFCWKSRGKIAGVCAGLAAYYEQPRWIIRVAAVVLLLAFPVVTVLAYLGAAVMLPEREY